MTHIKEWSETVSFNIDDVLDWKLYKETLRYALIDAAGLAREIPDEYANTWGGTVEIQDGNKFIVTLYPDYGCYLYHCPHR